jgi:hypothetical protein
MNLSPTAQAIHDSKNFLGRLILFERLRLPPAATTVAGPAYVRLLETSGTSPPIEATSATRSQGISPRLLSLFPSVPLSRAKKARL